MAVTLPLVAALGHLLLSARRGCGTALAPGETKKLVFAIGQGADADAAKELIARYGNVDAAERSLEAVHELWEENLGTIQVSGGEVVLGQWQRILMAELDGPRARSLRVQIFGISK